jgi:AraC family transcriptional regulator
MAWEEARLVHFASQGSCATKVPSDRDLSVTDPSSISLALLGTFEAALVETNGRTSQRRIVPGAVMLCGPEPIHWLGGSGSNVKSEFIEITATAALRREIAVELGVASHAELDDDYGWSDPIISAIAARFRSAARRMVPLSDIERDVLMRRLYGRVLTVRFGGREPARGQGGLDRIRLDRVVDFVEAHLEDRLTVGRLATVAALSPFHFVRAFRHSTGLTPHRYVRARRLERARGIIASGALIGDVARRIGYESLSHFRAAYRTHFGTDYEARAAGSRRRGSEN